MINILNALFLRKIVLHTKKSSDPFCTHMYLRPGCIDNVQTFCEIFLSKKVNYPFFSNPSFKHSIIKNWEKSIIKTFITANT